MAPDKEGKKRRNKRKSRTAEVSSASSSSESESESVASSVAPEPKKQKQIKTKTKNTKSAPADDSNEEDHVPNESVSAPERKVAKSSDTAFEEFYLRQAAQEFANDLDKLRSAGDFSAKSVPMLIAALKQGTACFGTEEKTRIIGAAEG